MNDLSLDRVIVGRFGRTHGIRGDIIIHSFTDPHENIEHYSPWWSAYINRQWQPIKPIRINTKTKHILAQIEGYDTQEKVSALTNVDIAIPREHLAALPAGEYYWDELIGMRVNNVAGDHLGQVTELLSTGSNDVLIVEGEKRYLIPYLLDKFIVSIDKEKKLIIVDWESDF